MKNACYSIVLIILLAGCRENLVDPADEQKRRDIVGLWLRTRSTPPSPSSTTLNFYSDSVHIVVYFESDPQRSLDSVYNYSISNSTISYYSLDSDGSYAFQGDNYIEALDRRELVLSFSDNGNKVVQVFERNR